MNYATLIDFMENSISDFEHDFIIFKQNNTQTCRLELYQRISQFISDLGEFELDETGKHYLRLAQSCKPTRMHLRMFYMAELSNFRRYTRKLHLEWGRLNETTK
jgi:hypothetical protein